MAFWDPIGVADLPEASGEYDSYLPMIRAALDGGDEIGLAASFALVRVGMGLSADPAADNDAARRLFEWDRGQR